LSNISDIGKDKTIKYDNKIFKIVDYQHVKPGKGGAFARTKLKNVETGRVIENTFRDNDKFEIIKIHRRKFQFLYHDGSNYWFMDNETFDQISVEEKVISNKIIWLIENMNCDLLYADEKIIDIEIPLFLELKIEKSEPGIKGDTSTPGTKPAILEGGVKIDVPLFINSGDIIKVDTRTGKYIERIK